MRRRIVVLLAMAVMAVAMLAASAPAFAQEGFDQGVGGCDANPGATEGSDSPLGTPPQGKPGSIIRNPEANEHDEKTGTGFGGRVEECT